MDPQLGQWVGTQRANCKEQYGVNLLNDIGFVWDTSGRINIPNRVNGSFDH